MTEKEELKKLRLENADLKQKINNYIPRRRVRRVYKQLKSILEMDIQDENKIYLQQLKEFITKIEKEGPQVADQNIKNAIEHLISVYDLQDPYDYNSIPPLGEVISRAVEVSGIGRRPLI